MYKMFGGYKPYFIMNVLELFISQQKQDFPLAPQFAI